MILWTILLVHSALGSSEESSNFTTPAATSKSSTAPTADLLKDPIPSGCLKYVAISSHLNVGKIKSFETSGGYDCWQYCKFLGRCESLTYDSMNGTCTLYNRSRLKDLEIKDVGDGATLISILKECVLFLTAITGPTMALEEVLSLSESREGVLIEQYSACLSGNTLQDTGKESYLLSWKPCHAADSWTVKEIGQVGNRSVYQIAL